MAMRNIVLVLLLCVGFTAASAQEVYNSSGKPGYHKKTKKHTGYDPDKLVIGGGMNLGFSSGYVNVGASPIVGYRFTKNWVAGVGLGYQFYKQPIYVDPVDPYKASYVYEHIVYPSLWSRYFVYRNIFVSGTFEYDIISVKQPAYDHYGNLGTERFSVTNPCLLLGVGLKQPIGGRVSFYGELVYDVLQGQYSPYPKNGPDIRFGICAGL